MFASQLQLKGSICLLHPAKITAPLSGRPKAYTDKAIAQALWKRRGNISEAAKILKCSPQTICAALGCGRMLREVTWEYEGQIFDIAYQTLRRYVQMGDLSASIFVVRQLWPQFGRSDAGDGLNSAVLALIKTKRDDDEDNLKVYTDETIAHALWEGYGIISEAAKILKCSRRTICNALARSPMLREIIWVYEGKIFDIAYKNVLHYAEMDNLTAIFFLLRLHWQTSSS
jgi:hypothetical protein